MCWRWLPIIFVSPTFTDCHITNKNKYSLDERVSECMHENRLGFIRHSGSTERKQPSWQSMIGPGCGKGGAGVKTARIQPQ